MNRQHASPILLSPDRATATILEPSPTGAGGHNFSEAAIQDLIQANPACLPISEIDPLFSPAIGICTELATPAGFIDNFLVTPTGLPILVECKLWRNPEGRREVVGQILDYAKELSRWSSSDLQREVSRRLKRDDNAMIDLVRLAGYAVDEIAFNDALSLNLRRGRFLLIIVGDGIRENVEAIAEYLQGHAGLHFSLGLVELPICELDTGSTLIVPRVLARTSLIVREVVAVPEAFIVRDQQESEGVEWRDDASTQRRAEFMREVIAPPLMLDPEQPTPKVSPKGWLSIYLPAPASSCWISVLLKDDGRRVGVRLTSNVNTIGEAAIARVADAWPEIEPLLNGSPVLRQGGPGRFIVEEFFATNISDAQRRAEALSWLRNRLAEYVAVFRPRIRDVVAEITS